MWAALRHALTLVTILSIKWLAGAGLVPFDVAALATPPFTSPAALAQKLWLGGHAVRSDVRGIGLLEARGPASPSPSCPARAAGPGPAPISFPARRSLTSRGVIVLDNDQAVLGLGDGESGGDFPSHQIDHNLQSKLHVYDLSADSRACRASAVEDPARADAPYLEGTRPVAARPSSSTLAQGPSSHVDKMATHRVDGGGGGGSGAATGGGGPGADGSRRVCAECVPGWGAPGEGVVRSGEVCVGWCAGAGDAGGSDEQAVSDARMCAAAP